MAIAITLLNCSNAGKYYCETAKGNLSYENFIDARFIRNYSTIVVFVEMTIIVY